GQKRGTASGSGSSRVDAGRNTGGSREGGTSEIYRLPEAVRRADADPPGEPPGAESHERKGLDRGAVSIRLSGAGSRSAGNGNLGLVLSEGQPERKQKKS